MSETGPSIGRLLAIGVALLALAGLSLALSFLPLGGFAVMVALAIAAVKAWLVARHYMELHGAHASVRIVAATALFFVLLLVVLTAADPATRLAPPLLPPSAIPP
jgi:cytochrome c oxidase subunit 4